MKRLIQLLVIAINVLVCSAAYSVEPLNQPQSHRHHKSLPALGINQTFGRWHDVVKLGYNPAGAPSVFADVDFFLSLLRESAQRWERVSGIRFEILPVGDYINDHQLPDYERDGVVSVTWLTSAENFSGRAGPLFGAYDEEYDQYPYADGVIELNNSMGRWGGGALGLTRTLTHEIGHLLGLGHSENPQSIMFADPYNQLQYPLQDDIRAVQTLYGPPAVPFDSASPIRDWQYSAPRLASAADRQPFLSDTYLSVGEIRLTNNRLDATAPDNNWLQVNIGQNNTNSQASQQPIALVLTDHNGYLYSTTSLELSCAALSTCNTWLVLAPVEVLKTLPGTWTLYINNSRTNELLHHIPLVVDTQPRFNQSPTAQIIVSAADNPYSVDVQVIAYDEEGDTISIVWDQFGGQEELGPDGVSRRQTFYGSDSGTQTYFIQLYDDSERYSGRTGAGSYSYAGRGFQTLIRLQLNWPLTGADSVVMTSSSLFVNETNTPNLLTFQPFDEPDPDEPDPNEPDPNEPDPQGPAPYNGVTPPPELGLAFNNIGIIDVDRGSLLTCVRITESGKQSELDGIELYDIDFNVIDFDRGEIQVVAARQFNQSQAVNEYQEYPDCSGQYETTTGIYSDLIVLGPEVYQTEFMVIDGDYLIFSLLSATPVN